MATIASGAVNPHKVKANALLALPVEDRARQVSELQEEYRESIQALKERASVEAERRALHDRETAALKEDQAHLANRLKIASEARDEVVRTKVAPELREAVKAADRAVRAADQFFAARTADASSGREAMVALKRRLAEVPSGANPKDLRAEIRRHEEESAKHEAAAAQAKLDLENAKAKAAAARETLEAAIQSAIGL